MPYLYIGNLKTRKAYYCCETRGGVFDLVDHLKESLIPIVVDKLAVVGKSVVVLGQKFIVEPSREY